MQHILSAATIPSYGLRSIDNYIAERYPRVRSALKGRRLLSYLINPHNQAIKISQEYFHEHHPRITQNFIKVISSHECYEPMNSNDSLTNVTDGQGTALC